MDHAENVIRGLLTGPNLRATSLKIPKRRWLYIWPFEQICFIMSRRQIFAFWKCDITCLFFMAQRTRWLHPPVLALSDASHPGYLTHRHSPRSEDNGGLTKGVARIMRTQRFVAEPWPRPLRNTNPIHSHVGLDTLPYLKRPKQGTNLHAFTLPPNN